MPIHKSIYSPPWFLKNAHVHTVLASYRRVRKEWPQPRTEVIPTSDGDELVVDWYRSDDSGGEGDGNRKGNSRVNKRLLIISHGLEGHSKRPYVLGMAAAAFEDAWDVLAWNYRGCAGSPNNLLTSYHSGCTDDLHFLVLNAVAMGYTSISLCGFSIGGNKTLLYLGRERENVPKEVVSGVAISVPCDLTSCSEQLAKPRNKIYMRNFLGTLFEKLKAKQLMFPNRVDLEGYKSIKNFEQFDGRYTAPINGFSSARDYWNKSSSLAHISKIEIPTALLLAKDDPFLTPKCFPYADAEQSRNFHLITTDYGGHVGFIGRDGKSHSEKVSLDFLNATNATNATAASM